MRVGRLISRRLTRLLFLGPAWLATSCVLFAPSEEEVQAEFSEYVSGANSCTTAEECAIASAPCPLGCFVAVRADRRVDVERKARELADDYETGGRHCDYECTTPGELTCTSGRCAVQ